MSLTSRSHEKSGTEFALDDSVLFSRKTIFRSDMMEGQRVVVTGGGTGIGKTTAALCARLGADVAICGRRQEKLTETAALINKATGRKVVTRAMSIRDPDVAKEFIQQVYDELGGMDVLVNNAGGQFPQDALDIRPKGWLAVIDTNLNGTWWMMQAAARAWRDRKQPGSIVNVVAPVERGCPQTAHTMAARAGVIAASRSVALEWAPYNIRVNNLAVAGATTEGMRQYPEEGRRTMEATNPMKRRTDAFCFAEALIYMSSPAAEYMTGTVITIDGGKLMWGTSWPAGRPEYFAGGE